jgi:hypothetical protein
MCASRGESYTIQALRAKIKVRRGSQGRLLLETDRSISLRPFFCPIRDVHKAKSRKLEGKSGKVHFDVGYFYPTYNRRHEEIGQGWKLSGVST